ncbi:uncharacterized protein RCO7_15075 [Rhynchosporium graminicola]|uniref:Uncharacterized protein n=1 Tax=Rhynchosporium graminicola TaxID=2792576 RepID=A0A1E1LJ28_9HELO|nr:uncharacterized protein RCO7_15075 [Rhynchosporium commune]
MSSAYLQVFKGDMDASKKWRLQSNIRPSKRRIADSTLLFAYTTCLAPGNGRGLIILLHIYCLRVGVGGKALVGEEPRSNQNKGSKETEDALAGRWWQSNRKMVLAVALVQTYKLVGSNSERDEVKMNTKVCCD